MNPPVTLAYWNEKDNPIGWSWVDEAWDYLSDDDTPRSEQSFFEIKKMQQAEIYGVYRGKDLGGMLIHTPISRYVTVGHCVFARRFWDGKTTVAALELGKRVAWEFGFRKIWCMCPADHRMMKQLLFRVGGFYEGRILHQIMRDGKMVDMASFALLKP